MHLINLAQVFDDYNKPSRREDCIDTGYFDLIEQFKHEHLSGREMVGCLRQAGYDVLEIGPIEMHSLLSSPFEEEYSQMFRIINTRTQTSVGIINLGAALSR